MKKHIRKLHISRAIETDPFCILKEQERFYKNLYKSNTTDPDIALKISSFLNDLSIPTLSEDQVVLNGNFFLNALRHSILVQISFTGLSLL